MKPTFTIKHKHFSKHPQGFALQLSVSVSSCLENAPCYSNRPVPHKTCLSLQKYNGIMECLIIS